MNKFLIFSMYHIIIYILKQFIKKYNYYTLLIKLLSFLKYKIGSVIPKLSTVGSHDALLFFVIELVFIVEFSNCILMEDSLNFIVPDLFVSSLSPLLLINLILPNFNLNIFNR